MRAWLLLSVVITACGRIGYDGIGADDEPESVALVPRGSLVGTGRDIAPRGAGAQPGYALAWAEMRPGEEQFQLVFAIASEEGVLLSPPNRLFALDRPPREIQIVPTEVGYTIFYQLVDGTSIRLVFLAPDGEFLETTVEDTDSYSTFDVTLSELGYLVVYSRSVAGNQQVHLRPIDFTGLPSGPGVRLDPTADRQDSAAIAYREGVAYIVWRDIRDGSLAFFARSDSSGTLLGPSAAVFNNQRSQTVPGIIEDGLGSFLVRWVQGINEGDELHLLRAAPDGTPIWPEPFLPYPPTFVESANQAMASSPDGVVGLVWERDADQLLTQISFARVGMEDDPLLPDPGVVLSDPAYLNTRPAIARGQRGFGVVFGCQIDATLALCLEVVLD